MRRRNFIALPLAAPALAAKYKPSLAVQVYVWTQHLRRANKSLADGLPEIFAGFASAGYHQLELTSNLFAPDIAGKTIQLIRQHKFLLPMIYHGGPFHDPAGARKTSDAILAFAAQLKPLGVHSIVTNLDPKPQRARKSDAEIAAESAALRDLGQALKGQGIRLLLHQHAPEMAENAREWRAVLQQVPPDLLGICLDVHWILRGGMDVMTLVRESGTRIGDIHLRNSLNGVWLEEFAPGDIDYPAVAAFLKSIHYQGLLTVELAWDPSTTITRPLAESLKRSRLYAESLFGVKA